MLLILIQIIQFDINISDSGPTVVKIYNYNFLVKVLIAYGLGKDCDSRNNSPKS